MEVFMIFIPIAVYMITTMILQAMDAGQGVSVTEKVANIIEQEKIEKHRIWYENFGRQQEIDAKIRREKRIEEAKQWFIMVSDIRHKE